MLVLVQAAPHELESECIRHELRPIIQDGLQVGRDELVESKDLGLFV